MTTMELLNCTEQHERRVAIQESKVTKLNKIYDEIHKEKRYLKIEDFNPWIVSQARNDGLRGVNHYR